MSITKGDVLTIPVYSQEAENNAIQVEWQQAFRARSARYYVVKAYNQSKDNTEVLIFIQDRFYKDLNRNVPSARQEDDSWVVSIDDRFQYGQKNRNGEGRWVALHDKDNKAYQHRYLAAASHGNITEQAKSLVTSVGGQIPDVGDYLHTF
ncbi:uncharacterized protein B0J16DRAFT_1272 [Fusarium flagelliforme]|uniref:Uncharacterized protein n=1 Tax=Fusarium flagelliforme TaxID=2675880 RepID=A0A395MFX7_9HYPO|nr:uncharacterized protein B0J16DRAFT_1272 [Fusarium flagelliforme]KAH7196518.1 hypothetical protein B0J16DRAFT_1272 [Fusarium flagelliforme]RFN46019.1 hypothetical protein FIE12Z_9707 [Fusarium flagelliforme]